MSTIFQLPVEIQKEFSIDNEGKASASQRGTARLAGVSLEAIRKLLLKLSDNLDVPKILKSYAGYSFKGDNLPDVLVALIIEYYGFEAGRYCTEQAKLVFRSFASMGFRVWAQKQLGWQKQQRKLSLEEIAFFANFASEAAQNAGVSKAVAESLKLDSIRQITPAAEPLLMLHKKAIASANPIPEKSLNPTELGKILAKKLGIAKISGRTINKKLIELGYQVSIKRVRKSTGKTVHDYYKPTEKATDLCQLEMTTYNQSNDGNSTKYQLRWFSGILEVLVNNW